MPAQDSARIDAAYIFWQVSAKKLETKDGIEPGCPLRQRTLPGLESVGEICEAGYRV